MGSNISISEAQEKVENVLKKFTSDYKVIVAKRATHTRLEKKITFGVTVKKSDTKDEELFDSLQKICIEEPDFEEVRSQAYLDNRTLKEDYLVSVIVKLGN